jgi:anti-sigma regulatory factor (Ser/Thr protein kinase)
MLTKDKILASADTKGKIRTSDFTGEFGVSRQYVNSLIAELVNAGALLRIGSTKNAFYALPEFVKTHPDILPKEYRKRFRNDGLAEHLVIIEIEKKLTQIKSLSENIKDIFTFAFSEMLNNAIEHSKSKNIVVSVSFSNDSLEFLVEDFGVGVFRNVMRSKRLHSELEAAQDILKGKTTTIPKSHTGQGIFFTSKAADVFVLDSFGQQLSIDNIKTDTSMSESASNKRGTRVRFSIKINSAKHLSDIFKEYTNLKEDSDYGFDKTNICVKLYTQSGVNISRSQARRILHGLEKFQVILFDFENVPMIGQAFADEIFRVFQNKHPLIELQTTNTNETVKFMIERARNDARI